MPDPSPTLADVARHLGVAAPTDASTVIVGINTLADARADEVSFLEEDRYADAATTTRAAAVIVPKGLADRPTNGRPKLVVDDAAAAVEATLALFEVPRHQPRGIDPSASIDPTATVAQDAAIGPGCRVGPAATIGRRTTLHANVVIGEGSAVGDGCELLPGVVVYERCSIGDAVTLHANCVIGSDGFGYRFDGTHHRKLAHVGTVVIEDGVEVGACTTIDRGKFAETRIGAGTKIDNLVQIAHNVRVGRACIICANVGIAGSTTLGNGVILAGGAGIKDHITIGDRARVAAFSGPPGDVPPGETIAGAPGVSHRVWLREQAAIRKLPDLAREVRALRKRLDELGTT